MQKKKSAPVVSVTLEIPTAVIKQIDVNAEEADRSRSAEIRQLLLRALAANEKTV